MLSPFRYLAAIALLSLAAPAAHAQAGCALAVAADFPVTYIDHIPVVTVKMHGQNVRMEVDTGSGMSFITTATYDQLNLTGIYPTTGAYSTGVAGTMQMNMAIMQNIDLGQVTLHDEIFGIADSAAVSSHGLPLVGGVIGEDIMQLFDVGLDLPDNHIIFYRPQHCAATETPWTGDFAPLPITRHKETLASTVDYGIDNATLAATIDTGAEMSLVAQQALTRDGLAPEAIAATRAAIEGIGLDQIGAASEKFASITIGAESFGDMWLTVANTPMVETTDALIGEDYLSTHRVFIANSSNTAFFGLTQPHISP